MFGKGLINNQKKKTLFKIINCIPNSKNTILFEIMIDL